MKIGCKTLQTFFLLCKRTENGKKNYKLKKIDVIKINIEGAEFDLLNEVIKKNYQTKFDNIQVQFHKMFDDSHEKRDIIRKKLSETHQLTYDYTFVWENWKIKKNGI